jgi:hypothetical protein
MHKQIKEAKKTYKQTIGPCQDPTDHTVPRMEELFMRAFSRAIPFFCLLHRFLFSLCPFASPPPVTSALTLAHLVALRIAGNWAQG